MLGTARYASPEQAQGQPVDGKADVYSLGLLLIECVTGTVPFAADTTIATLMARVGKPVEVPEALGPLRKALERAGLPDAADRPDAGELGIALMATAEELPRPEPLPLADGMPVDATGDDDRRATPRCSALALAGTRLADPGEPTVVVDAAERATRSPSPRHRSGSPTTSSSRPTTTSAAAAAGPGRSSSRCSPCSSAAARPSPTRSSAPRATRSPTCAGMTEAEARAEAEALGFEVERQESREDGSTPGTVLGTEPAAGEELDEGDTLTLIISLGNTPAPVPTDLVGKTLEEATQILADAGGFTPEVTEQESEDGRRRTS